MGINTRTSTQTWFQVVLCHCLRLNLVSLFLPVALLGMGVALPNVVNLHYVTPEVFVHKVRGCGCDQRGLSAFGGRLGFETRGSPLSLSPR